MIKHLKNKLKALLRELKLSNYIYFCPICNSNIENFIPLPDSYRKNAEIHGYKYFGENEHLNIHQYSCPVCGSADRDRFYATFLKKHITDNIPEKTLLHIAPAWKLNDLFLKKYVKVVTTDLMMKGVDYYMHIEDMKEFEENTFDYFICSHVLEHVKHPDKALQELYRILKPNGIGIIMAPINPNIQYTIEDPSHISKEDRIKHYGQDDHLRLFSKSDFINRIKKANFKLQLYGIDYFGERTFKKIGLKESSILYVGIK